MTITDPADRKRASIQREQVLALMSPGDWWTIPELQSAGVKGSETGISARIRDFRKAKY